MNVSRGKGKPPANLTGEVKMTCLCGHPKKHHTLGLGKCLDCGCDYYEDVSEVLADTLADYSDETWWDEVELDDPEEGEDNG